MRAINCYRCGLEFAMTVDYYNRRLNDKADWFCPNGHSQRFIGKTAEQLEIERLKSEVASKQRAVERADEARRWAETSAKGARIQAGKAKAAQRRLEHRVNCGVCPHCKRTFKQLAAHMKSKHPEVR